MIDFQTLGFSLLVNKDCSYMAVQRYGCMSTGVVITYMSVCRYGCMTVNWYGYGCMSMSISLRTVTQTQK